MKTLLVVLSMVALSTEVLPQGCVIIRNVAGFGQFPQLGYNQSENKWMMNVSARYFESVTAFKDSKQLPLAPDPSNRNINYNYTYDFSLYRVLDSGWGLGMDLPISSNTLVTRAEHLSGDRHSTHAFGIGDVRFTVFKWLRKQEGDQKWNIQAGLGLKLPTGNYHSEDYFYNDPINKSSKTLAPVDPSLQLGDGGTGITAELNMYYRFDGKFSLYGNFFYMASPCDQNGVSNLKGHPIVTKIDSAAVDATLTVNSVPDNYTLRAGGNFTFFDKIVFTTGLRLEGVPRHDLIGEDHGLRRVGHVASVEIGAQYKLKNSFFYAFVPIAFDRGLAQSVPDQIQSQILGTYQSTAGRIPALTMMFGYAFIF